ncbi:MAG: tetratricopeptide repeat protein [Lentisphaeria bacterium]
MLNRWVAALTVVAVMAIGVWGVFQWRSWMVRSRFESRLAETQGLLEKKKPAEALQVLYSTRYSPAGKDPNLNARFCELEVRILVALQRITPLLQRYTENPSLFLRNEEAAQLVVRALMERGSVAEARALRNKWRNRETQTESWFMLDVDTLIRQGKRDKAVTLLKSRRFPGTGDSNRLARLAILAAPTDLPAAWNYLNQAMNVDPRNPEIRLFRAQMLENAGLLPAARSEYQAAMENDGQRAYFREQLADFHRRHGDYGQMLLSLTQGLTPESPDHLWLRAWFWNRVAAPASLDWNKLRPTRGELEPLIGFLLELPAAQFWDPAGYQALPGAERYLRANQELFWLQLLEALRRGDEPQALELLSRNRFRSRSWQPDLEAALERILQYRRVGPGKMPPAERAGKSSALPGGQAGRHQFFPALEAFLQAAPAKPRTGAGRDPIATLLDSRNVFSAAFLAGGWLEAALQLNRLSTIPADYPDWLAYGLAQALRSNRGPEKALEFCQQQEAKTPALQMLEGELLLAIGKTDAAMKQLATVAPDNSPAGLRAAWLLSLARIEAGDLAGAAQVVQNQPRLAGNVLGKEILARLAWMRQDTATATRLYQAIEQESLEAKVYLARLAFSQKDYPRAETLTRALLRESPDTPQFHENLRLIHDARNGGAAKPQAKATAP